MITKLEEKIDCRYLIYLLATSKYPIKLRTLNTLYLDFGDKYKINDWIYTTGNGYLTVKRNRRILRRSEIFRNFLLESMNSPISLPFIDLCVYSLSIIES